MIDMSMSIKCVPDHIGNLLNKMEDQSLPRMPKSLKIMQSLPLTGNLYCP